MTDTVWTPWDTNPFRVALSIAKPEHVRDIQAILAESMIWDSIEPNDYMDDLLQEIAGRTNLVVQYSEGPFGSARYRAAYDKD